jgi:hypothetical protein
MTACNRATYFTFALSVAGVSGLACLPGCKENDPTPSYNADLGEEGSPLVPTAAAVHNVKIKNGSADWLPFREPELPDEHAGMGNMRGHDAGMHGDDEHDGMHDDHDGHDDAAADGETEKAIRDAVAEYNDALAKGTTEDILEFLTEDQGKIAETLLPTLASLNTKLGELAKAIPAQASAIEAVQSQLAATSLLKIDIDSIMTKGDKSVMVMLASSPLPAFLPGLSDEAKGALGIMFTLGDDEYWYIESPIVSALGSIEPALKLAVTEIDGLLSGGSTDDPAALAATKTLSIMLPSEPRP